MSNGAGIVIAPPTQLLPTVTQTQTGSGTYTSEGPTINGIKMPGQWLLTRCRRSFGWQEQQANFMSGAYLVPKGDPLSDAEYEVRLWEQAAMTAFLQLLGTILKKPAVVVPGGNPASAALGIDDLILKSVGIINVVVLFVEPPKNPLVSSGGRGPWVAQIGFKEYRPPVPALPVPDQTIPDVGPVTPSATANAATAAASVTSGASNLQGAAARRFVPPR